MSRKKITIQAWAAQRFDPCPADRTLQRWARDCCIYPLPQKVGRQWMVEERAEYVGPNARAVSHESQAA